MSPSKAALLALLSLTLAAPGALAAPKGAPAARPDAAAGADKDGQAPDLPNLPPLPADASVRQVTHVAGRTVDYTATVGVIPVRDDTGRKTAEVVFTAYTLDGPREPGRPVTFAFNGGPGASSVYLNMGAIGPKHVQFGAQGDSPSDPVRLTDNPGTWLDFTDLVFIDPVGTGYSRSLVKPEETDKSFFTIDNDIKYLSRIVYDWLAEERPHDLAQIRGGRELRRLSRPGHRPRAADRRMGVGVSGVVMVSPALDGRATASDP